MADSVIYSEADSIIAGALAKQADLRLAAQGVIDKTVELTKNANDAIEKAKAVGNNAVSGLNEVATNLEAKTGLSKKATAGIAVFGASAGVGAAGYVEGKQVLATKPGNKYANINPVMPSDSRDPTVNPLARNSGNVLYGNNDVVNNYYPTKSELGAIRDPTTGQIKIGMVNPGHVMAQTRTNQNIGNGVGVAGTAAANPMPVATVLAPVPTTPAPQPVGQQTVVPLGSFPSKF